MNLSANILIIDDELGSRESLKMILKHSYQVFTAESGKAAMEIIRQVPIDLVTLDLRMPAMHGNDVLREIKVYNPEIDVVIVTGFGTLKSATDAIRYGVFDYILKPFNVVEIMSVVKRSIEKRHLDRRHKDVIRELENICITERASSRDADGNDNIFASVEHILSQSTNNFPCDKGSVDCIEFVRVLAATLEINDPYTHGHSDRVHHYSTLLAQDLDFNAEQSESIQIAAFLHDIGKIGVGNVCIQKEGRLTEVEQDLVRQHPEKGVELVGPLRLPPATLSIIRHHHERFDGRGYPARLAGDQIPVAARIISITDAFDAMISNRPYRKAMSHDKVIDELILGKQAQFDPFLVDRFITILESDDFTPPSRLMSSPRL